MKFLRIITACLLFAAIVPAKAQPVEGVITYEQITDWTRIYAGLSYLSQEEKDRVRLTRASWNEEKTDMKLVFTPDKSYYTYVSNQREYGDGRFTAKLPEFIIYRDFGKNQQTDHIEMLGRVYLVEDSIRLPQWKVMNKIKDVQGHVCMMAVTEDTIRNQKITAWFADDLPASVGPGLYYGLPGAILELEINEGDIVISAKKIELKPVGDEIQLPRKLKGRKIDAKTYDNLIYKHITDNVKARRYPYGSIPL